MSESPDTTTPQASTERRGALRFLFRTPLGIVCLVVSLLLIALAALPSVASRLAPSRAADWFASRYHGRLELERLDLAWTGAQTVTGAKLLDPAGTPIASVDVELPGLWSLVRSGGTRIGKVVVRGEVALSADDEGRTNLQRALEPRAAAAQEGPGASPEPNDAESSSAAGELELELDLQLSRVEWSDARTRALGQPVRIEGLRAAAKLRPGEPIVASVIGELSGAASGRLDVAAKVVNAFAPPSSATPPSAELRAEVRGLPMALVDGLAKQEGRLSALLGETLDATVQGSGTLQSGALSLDLATPLARVGGELELRGGVLSTRGDGLRAELTAGPGLDAFLATTLDEPSLRVARLPDAGPSALRLVLSEFELPVAPWLDAKAAGRPEEGLSTLARGARATLGVTAGGWRVDARREGAPPLAVELPELELALRLVEPTQPSMLTLKAATRASGPGSAGAPGQILLDLELPGGVAALSSGPRAGIEGLRVKVACNALPTGVLDALLALQGDLTAVAGDSASATVTIAATLAPSEDLPANWGAAGAAWRQLAARATVSADVALGGSSTGAPLRRLGGEPLAVHRVDAKCTLSPEGPAAIAGSLVFATRQPGRIEFDASVSGLFAAAGATGTASEPQFAITAKATGLSTAVGDAIVGQGPLLQPLIGPSLTIECSAQGGEASGVARISITSESADMLATARWADGQLVDLGEPALRISLQPDAEFLEAKLAPHLPAGTHLSFSDSRGAFGLTVPRLSLPIDELRTALTNGPLPGLQVLVERTRLDVMIAAREFLYSDPSMAAAGVGIEALGIQGQLELRPRGAEGGLTLDLSATSPSFGTEPIHLHVEAPDPGGFLFGASTHTPFRANARLVMRDMTTALLDAYAKGALAAPMGPVLQADVAAVVAVAPARMDATLDMRLAGSSGESKISMNARVADLGREGIPPLDAKLDVQGSSTWIAFAPESVRADLQELLGDAWSARVALKERPGDGPGTVVGTVSCDAARLRVDAPLESSANRLRTTGPVTLSISPTQAMLDRHASTSLPPGAKLTWAATPTEAERAVELRIPSLDVAVPGAGAPDGFDPATLLRDLRLELEAKLPGMDYVHPPAVAGQMGSSAQLRDLRLLAHLAPNEDARFDLTGAVGGDGAGKLEVHAVVRAPEGFVDPTAQPYPASGSSVKLDATLAGFPSALLDTLARQDGLLIDVLGPTLDARVQGHYPEGAGDALHAELKSNLGEVRLDSRLQAGVIRSSESQGLDAKLGLTPLFSQRIVGSLLPVLVSVRQDDPGHRTLLSGRNLALPLDGDLAKLSGEIVLDLGAVDYQLLPGLEQAFAIAGTRAPQVKNTVIRPITIRIVDGVARYDSIPIRVGGRELSLRGSADLGKQSFELAFSVPLELLGSKVESKLESLRKVLDPKLEVPLELYGSWTSPRVRLGKGFLEKTLKDAAGKALEGELEKGLGDLFGDKKKKKKDG